MRIAIVVATEPEVKPLGLGGDLETNLKMVAELGYDGVELFVGQPNRFAIDDIKKLIKRYGLSVPAIGTGLTYTVYGLSFTSSDRGIRERAVERVKEYLKLGKELNSPIIIGSIKGRVQNYYRGMENLKNCLRECAEFAEESGCYMLIEPLNRYESNVINTLEEAVELIKSVGSETLKILGDTFHMNIEERSICESLREVKEYLYHVHLADSNRQAPGQGHIDFRKILDTLREIGFKRFGTVEILPLPDQYTAAKLAAEYLRSLT